MRALICGVDPTLAHHVSITKCKMPNMRQNLHKFMHLLKPAHRRNTIKYGTNEKFPAGYKQFLLDLLLTFILAAICVSIVTR